MVIVATVWFKKKLEEHKSRNKEANSIPMEQVVIVS
jgi:hypothetical protein